MTIERIAETDLTPQDDAAIAALLSRAFGTDFGGRSYFHQPHHLRLVLRDPGIVGHVALCLRRVRRGGADVQVAGLAEVATDPSRRGEGIAGRLLAEAIAWARAKGVPHLLLFGDAALYGAAGFRPSRQKMTWLDLAGDGTRGIRTAPAESLMVLSLGPVPWYDGVTLDLMGHLF